MAALRCLKHVRQISTSSESLRRVRFATTYRQGALQCTPSALKFRSISETAIKMCIDIVSFENIYTHTVYPKKKSPFIACKVSTTTSYKVYFYGLPCAVGSTAGRGNVSPSLRVACSVEGFAPITSRIAFLSRTFAYFGCTKSPLHSRISKEKRLQDAKE